MYYPQQFVRFMIALLLTSAALAGGSQRLDADLTIRGGSEYQQRLIRTAFTTRIPLTWRQSANLAVQILADRAMDAYIHSGSDAHVSGGDQEDAIDGIFEDDPPTITLRGTDDASDLPMTFAHELGHYYWQKRLTGAQRSRYVEVYSKQKSSHHLVTDYAATDVHEGFAEAFSYFLLARDVLRRRDPLSCRFLDKLFDGAA